VRLPWLEGADPGADPTGGPGPADESPLRRALLLPLDGVALGYAVGARLHRALYAGRWLPPRRLPCRVVSVGSLVTGGAGKTPLAAWIAGRLRARGHRVALATRGYGGTRRDPVHALSDGRFVRGDVVGVGDEPLVLAAHAAGVPVLVGRDRGVVGLRAISTFGTDVLVLDDGFQHHRLQRDIDIVTFDGRFGFGNGRVLPRGPLRESPKALVHAHAVAVFDGPLSPHALRLLEKHTVTPLVFEVRRRPVRLRGVRGPKGSAPASEPAAALAGMRVGMLAALGRPEAFRRTLEEQGATVVAQRTFRDHHRYRARDLRGLEREAPLWITTEKDAVKILPGWSRRIDLRVLTIELAVSPEAELLDWLEARLA
jgi:tetraacyldisaccharide 4'-kinase